MGDTEERPTDQELEEKRQAELQAERDEHMRQRGEVTR